MVREDRLAWNRPKKDLFTPLEFAKILFFFVFADHSLPFCKIYWKNNETLDGFRMMFYCDDGASNIAC